MSEDHRFLQFDSTNPLISEVRSIAAYLLNKCSNVSLSPNQYRKKGLLKLTPTGSSKAQASFYFNDLVDHIQSTRTFDHTKFNLPALTSDWLEGMIIGKPDAPIANLERTAFAAFELDLPFGPAYKARPCIDREGVAYTSFQIPIQDNIVRVYRTLVDTSNLASHIGGVWITDFRMLLNESISLIDTTLHQIYYMAMYRAADRGWKFNADDLKKEDAMRVADKLRWVGKITGKALDDVKKEMESFLLIKELRNHFNHFDPPSVAYTMEDLVDWMNRISDIGRLAWKIRDRVSAQISRGIIEIITLPRVMFVPTDPNFKRVNQGSEVGYASVRRQDRPERPSKKPQIRIVIDELENDPDGSARVLKCKLLCPTCGSKLASSHEADNLVLKCAQSPKPHIFILDTSLIH